MTVRSKPLTLSLSAQCPSHARTDVRIRDHTLICDEPVARGGTDQGAAPVEVLIAALAGCTNVILNRVAEMQGARIEGLSIEARAELDTRGIREGLDLALPIPRVELTLDLATDAGARRWTASRPSCTSAARCRACCARRAWTSSRTGACGRCSRRTANGPRGGT